MSGSQRAGSAVEEIKRASRQLRGDLAKQLANGEPNFTNDAEQLLKFHGIYAQDHRDVRRERSVAGQPLEYIFMIRVAIPGGRLTGDQWLALDRIAGELADGSIRLTTRQAVQFHGVSKADLRSLAQQLDSNLMTSFGACGDVVRNTVSCPTLGNEDPGGPLARLADGLSKAFKSTSTARWEIFVNGERAATREVQQERSFYGDTYLPRKFKIGIANPEENCVDVFTQDIGLIPGKVDSLGCCYHVLVGGGLGRSYAHPDTFARLADPLTFVSDDQLEQLIAAILHTYRDLGDRGDRRRARMKYVVADLGIERFRKEIESRLGGELAPPRHFAWPSEADDHLGWRRLADGAWQIGVRVGAGRVRNESGGPRLRSALRELAACGDFRFLITAQQDVIVSEIGADQRRWVEQLLSSFGVARAEDLGRVERLALACPALPTCGLALAEAERRLPELVSLIEQELHKRSPGRRRIQLRMTGCPNGCARPAVAEVGVIGRSKSTYDLYIGGGLRGDRLASLYREKVTLEEIPGLLAPLFERWECEGEREESFGDFLNRAVLS
ncbi:MAG TPA: NADPH-dependent assimilatory sulfite reductase hemoprotein subunit [Acidimicrobiales bacterium]|nr:NADPH-dependent assimilatory sulfite reductase hemoprotein subunit [Acidimicrobiales bacterium]